MGIVIFNAFLYIITLIIYWYKRRKRDGGFLLLLIYTTVAILGIPLYIVSPEQWKLTLWPYLYLFIVFMLFFRPYLFDNESLYYRLKVKDTKVLIIISVVYILNAVIVTFYSLPQAIDAINSGEWLTIRNEFNAEEISLYSNQIDRFAKIFTQYFQIAAIVILFYFLTLRHITTLWKILLAIAIILPMLLVSVITASRGLLFGLFINLLIGYLIFRKGISGKTKRLISISSIPFLILALVFVSSVTMSRFGEDAQSSSILSYLGHSFMTFNYGVADSIHNYAYGRYFFKWFYDLFGINSTINYIHLGTHFETGFITFVGTLYVDFGAIGTFLIALFFPIIISRSFRHKKTLDIADIFMYTFYLSYLVNGVFVVGYGNSLSWLMAIIVYILLKSRRFKNTTSKKVLIR